MSQVRVRFAPSPTGPLHIGGVRTALFNYLFAKKNNGAFILRIEDTDQKRFVEGAEQYIVDSLDWLSLTLDESPKKGGDFGPYRQSERNEIYKKYIPELLASGYAYYAFDTTEALEKKREEYETKGETFSYNANIRKDMDNSLGMTEDQLSEKLLNKVDYVIRFKMPENEDIMVNDLIRGSFVLNSKELDDKVLVKADGLPTYHLANVIDDHEMQISHVIRGEEWLPSLPLHILLYRAFNWSAPQFAHLPLLLKPEGNGKLSKRDGAKLGFPVFPMEWKEEDVTYLGFKELGYYPKTMVNFLVSLGWTPQPENEVFSLEELANQFEIEKVHKAGARFDIKKAEYINKEILHEMSISEVMPEFIECISEWKVDTSVVDSQKVVEVMKDRVSFINEMVSESLFFYESPMAFNEELIKKATVSETQNYLKEIYSDFEKTDWNQEDISQSLQNFTKEKNLGMGKIMMPLRLAMVGEMKGPDVPVIMEILGKQESLKRIEFFQKFIQV